MKPFESLQSAFCSGSPERIVALDHGKPISVCFFRSSVKALAAFLNKSDCKKIAICIDDAFDFAVALISCIICGKQVVLPGHSRPELLSEDDCSAVIISDGIRPAGIKSEIEFYSAKQPGTAKTDLETEAVFPSDAVIELRTSGSTGKPKAVLKTLKDFEKESAILRETFKSQLSRTDFVISSVFPCHMYGLTFRIFLPLLSGIPFERSMHQFQEQLPQSSNPLLFVTSPAFIKRMDFKSKSPVFSMVLSAGGMLPEESAIAFGKWSNKDVTEIYGSTESGVIAWRQAGPDNLYKAFKGISLSTDKDGIVHLTSPIAPNMSLSDGISFKENGFKITGRLDRIVKIEERRISLDYCEQIMKKDPIIIDAACLLIKRNNRDFLSAAVVVNQKKYNEQCGGRISGLRSHLLYALREFCPVFMIPRLYRVTDQIPVNPMGKRLSYKIKELFDDPA